MYQINTTKINTNEEQRFLPSAIFQKGRTLTALTQNTLKQQSHDQEQLRRLLLIPQLLNLS